MEVDSGELPCERASYSIHGYEIHFRAGCKPRNEAAPGIENNNPLVSFVCPVDANSKKALKRPCWILITSAPCSPFRKTSNPYKEKTAKVYFVPTYELCPKQYYPPDDIPYFVMSLGLIIGLPTILYSFPVPFSPAPSSAPPSGLLHSLYCQSPSSAPPLLLTRHYYHRTHCRLPYHLHHSYP